MTRKIRFISPTGMLGAGFSESYFRAALSPDIAFVGCDSGSIDGGPANLGGNEPIFPRAAIKRDLRVLILGTREFDIPLMIGSCGGSGGSWNLNWTWEIVQEIAREENLHFKTALIESEMPRETLIQKYNDGKVKALSPAPAIDEDILRNADHIVGMMGAEGYVEAIKQGAQVVLAGRSSDSAIFASLPVDQGFPPGLCWHAGKIMECGGAAVAQMGKQEGLICTITDDAFTLEPVSPDQKCTPLSVAAHALYETSDPYFMLEPGGEMDLSNAVYEAVDDRIVAVKGSEFHPKPYTVKLEGASAIGYRSMILGGVRDPVLLESLDSWIDELKQLVANEVENVQGESIRGKYQVSYKVYGKNGVMGEREPNPPEVCNEVGLLIVALAETQEIAKTIVASAGFIALHLSVPAWEGYLSNMAFPISPHVTDLGQAYRFMLNHVVELDEPLELHQIQYKEI